jgi:hypothetical protein
MSALAWCHSVLGRRELAVDVLDDTVYFTGDLPIRKITLDRTVEESLAEGDLRTAERAYALLSFYAIRSRDMSLRKRSGRLIEAARRGAPPPPVRNAPSSGKRQAEKPKAKKRPPRKRNRNRNAGGGDASGDGAGNASGVNASGGNAGNASPAGAAAQGEAGLAARPGKGFKPGKPGKAGKPGKGGKGGGGRSR